MVRYLSKHANNTIVGLVRNKAATEKKVAEELKDAPAKIHILAADMDSYDSLKVILRELIHISTITGAAYSTFFFFRMPLPRLHPSRAVPSITLSPMPHTCQSARNSSSLSETCMY